MVRIKFTSPVQAVQLQSKPETRPIVSNAPNATGTTVSVQEKTTHQENVQENAMQIAVQESTALKQQQSLEMVQIMLHVSFGTLFYLREFLPLRCFDDRDLKQAQRQQEFSYQDFIDGRTRTDRMDNHPGRASGQGGKRSQPLKVLMRNSDPKVDTILDLLENGIFDALKKHVLEAVQLTVLVDKDKPTNVLESYTFTFKYTEGSGDVGSRLESLSLDPVGYTADMKTAQSARMGLEMIVRRLITLSAFLPTLPNKRNLGIHLFYTGDCPADYEPPGFAGATDDTINYPLNDSWRKECQSCGTMDSGYHAVGLKVTSLKWIGPDPDSPEAQPEIPAQIKYDDAVPRTEDIGLPHEGHSHEGCRSEQSTLQEATQMTQTQIHQDISARQRLEGMIPMAPPSQDSDLVPTQPFNANANAGNNGNVSQHIHERTILSRKKAAEIRQHLRSKLSDFSEKSADQNSQSPVKCQCGWEGEERAMIECGFCHTRQHLLCYGFRDLDDSRLPDIHSCYQCLLEPGETNLLREMNTLVLLRRALRIILNEGHPNTVSAFTQKLHCNGHTVVQITDLLRKQGYLQPNPKGKRKGSLRKGLSKFSVPLSGDVRKKMETEILDPFAKIQHHYVQDSPDADGHVRGPSSAAASQDTEVEMGKNGLVEGTTTSSKEMRSIEMDIDDDQETLGSGDELVDLGSEGSNGKRKLPLSQDESQDETNNHDDDPRRRRSDLKLSSKEEPALLALSRNRNHSSQTENATKGALGDHKTCSNTSGITARQERNTTTATNVPNETSPAVSSTPIGIRRSPRKRRKASNYAQLIDVGMAASDE